MRKSNLLNLFVLFIVALTILQSCKDDGELTALPPVANQSFVEEFDTTAAAIARGWSFQNTSDLRGSGIWQDGGEINPWFQAFSNRGNKAGFIGVDYTSTTGGAVTISNWLFSPSVIMQNGDKIIFYTRGLQYDDGAGDSTDYGNSLQVCINPRSDFINVGQGTDMGSFETVYEINPSLIYSSKNTPVANAYPTQWTRFEVTLSGFSKPTTSRFAFRYYVTGGGNAGNGSGVAIDQVSYISVSK